MTMLGMQMQMQQQDVLRQMAMQRAPLFGGTPFTPDFGFGGTPLAEHPLLGLIAQPLAASVMGRMGMAPMGMNDRNAFDVMRNQRFFRMQQQVQTEMAESDRQNWMNSLRGMAAVAGVPWGSQQIQAARGITDFAVSAAPMMNMIAPDLMDEMAGYRGSAAVMAGRMMSAGRYRIDPVTGRLGQDATQVAATAKKMYDEMFVQGNMKETGGLSAGQVGQMYEQLSMRGMIAGPTRTPAQEVARLAREDPTLVNDAAARQGLNVARFDPNAVGRPGPSAGGTGGFIQDATRAGVAAMSRAATPDLSKLSGDELDKLTLDPAVADKLRSFDADRVKKSISAYTSAVNAVRDIFGEMGKPNAPMSELVGALDSMSNGSLAQVQPGQLSMMVRMTGQLAQDTGVGMNNAMIMQQHFSQRGSQMGLEPAFAVGATQSAMAFGKAYGAMGLSPAWGAMTPDEMSQLHGHMQLGAAASVAAQRMGVAMRLSDRLGGFAPGTDAAAYVEALRTSADTGANTWVDSSGKQRDLNLSKAEYTKVLTSTGRVTEADIAGLTNQRATNREPILRYGLDSVAQRGQARDVKGMMGGPTQGWMAAEMERRLVATGMSATEAAKLARSAGTRDAARGLAAEVMDIDMETFRDPKARTAAIGEAVGRALDTTAEGRQVHQRIGNDLRLSAESLYGSLDQAARLGPMHTSIVALHDAVHPQANQRASAIVVSERLQAQVREELAPLNRGSMLRRAMGYLQQIQPGAAPGNEELGRLAATALGGVDQRDVQTQLAPAVQKVQAAQKSLEEQQRVVENANAGGDPKQMAAAQAEFARRREALHASVGAVQSVMGSIGADVADRGPTADDTSKAVNLGKRTDELRALASAPQKGGYEAFGKTGEGKEYAERAKAYAESVDVVTSGILTSPAAGFRFGPEGTKAARAARDASDELTVLAQQYSGGDVARLMAGDYDAGKVTPGKEGEVKAAVARSVKVRDDAVKAIDVMANTAGNVWARDQATVEKTAKTLGIDKETVGIVGKMTPGMMKKAEAITKMEADAAELRERHAPQATQDALAKRTEAARTDLATEYEEKVTMAGIDPKHIRAMKAAGLHMPHYSGSQLATKAAVVRGALDKQHAEEAGDVNVPPDVLAGKFLESLGVPAGGDDPENKEKLKALGTKLQSESGRGLRARLVGDEKFMEGFADEKKYTGKTAAERVAQMKAEYEGLTDEKSKEAFRQKTGMKDDDWSRMQQSVAFEKETGFYRFGPTRSGFNVGGGVDEATRQVDQFTKGGAERTLTAVVKDGIHVSGTLTIAKDGSAKMDAVSSKGDEQGSAGKDHSP